MKALFTAVIGLLALSASARPTEPRDSIVVQFGGKSKLIIYTESKEDFRKIQNYDVNALLRDLGVKIDSISPTETRVVVTETNGNLYLRDSTLRRRNADEKDYVRIGIRGVHVKDGADEVHVSWNGIYVKDGAEEVRIGHPDSTRWSRQNKNRWLNRGGFYLNLGLNNYVGSGNSNSPNFSYTPSVYDLRPLGSRHIAFGWAQNARIVQGRNTALSVRVGLEASWYNFMFDGNNVATRDATAAVDRVSFPESVESLQKSKLTVAYLNVPIMPTISFRHSAITYIGLGGTVGYRLDSYTKVKRDDGGKDRVHGNYYLNNFRYGLRAEVGIRNFPDLFFNYDLNPLFAEGRGPDLRAISFGFKL